MGQPDLSSTPHIGSVGTHQQLEMAGRRCGTRGPDQSIRDSGRRECGSRCTRHAVASCGGRSPSAASDAAATRCAGFAVVPGYVVDVRCPSVEPAAADCSGPVAAVAGHAAGGSGPVAAVAGHAAGGSGPVAAVAGHAAGGSGPVAAVAGHAAAGSGPVAAVAEPAAVCSGLVAAVAEHAAACFGLVAAVAGHAVAAAGSGLAAAVAGHAVAAAGSGLAAAVVGHAVASGPFAAERAVVGVWPARAYSLAAEGGLVFRPRAVHKQGQRFREAETEWLCW